MPDYVRKALDRFHHPNPKRPQYAPHRWAVPAYGKKTPNSTISRRERSSGKKGHLENTVHCGDPALLCIVSTSNDATDN